MNHSLIDSAEAGEESLLIYPLGIAVVVGLACSLVTFLTIAFNVLTLTVFTLSPQLRNFGDYFILNLAVADTAIGLVSMPPYIPYQLTGRWLADKVSCLMWITWDYAVTTSSVYNMCIISFDRYMMVVHPLKYRNLQSRRLHTLMMLPPWCIGIAFFAPSVLAYPKDEGFNESIENEQCYAPHAFNLCYTIFAISIGFFCPFVVISGINLMICINIRRRINYRKATLDRITPSTSLKSESQGTTNLSVPQRRITQTSYVIQLPSRKIHPKVSNSSTYNQEDDLSDRLTSSKTTPTPVTQSDGEKPKSHKPKRFWPTAVFKLTSKKRTLKRDKRITHALFILVLVFAACWLPFQSMALIGTVCTDCYPLWLWESSYWLLWVNSTVNPILYPLLHKRFREALWRLMRKAWARCHRQRV